MEFGYGVPTRGPQASPEALATLARRGEALGYDIVSVSDHVVIPRQIASRYPYSESGTFGGGGDGACLEQLTLLAFLAGQTSRLRLLTSVMVVPHRSAVLAAKVLASIDVLSGGRLIVGCGVGWMREEFEALGAPPYDHRGTVSDEYIQAFRELWTKESPAYAGGVRQLLGHRLCAQAGAELRAAHLGGRRESGCPAARRPPWRRLVPHWQQSQPPPRDGIASEGGDRNCAPPRGGGGTGPGDTGLRLQRRLVR